MNGADNKAPAVVIVDFFKNSRRFVVIIIMPPFEMYRIICFIPFFSTLSQDKQDAPLYDVLQAFPVYINSSNLPGSTFTTWSR